MKSKKPLISVLINNYNYAGFIKQCIDSVLNQTYQNFEIIFVDDGSADNSKEVVETYTDKRIKSIFKKNGGQASAFNVGFEASKGEIICFLDSDDWWKENKLETLLKWHNFLDGDYAMIQHVVDIWYKGEISPFRPALYQGDCFTHTIETGQLGLFVGSSGLSFTREMLDKVMPVPEILRISADAYLTRTTFTFGHVYSIPDCLGYYRKHNNAVLGNSTYDHIDFTQRLLFPLLNSFYEKQGIEYRFKIHKKEEEPKPENPSKGRSAKEQPVPARPIHDKMLMQFLMKRRLDEIISEYGKVAIFGAGLHTVWMSSFLDNYRSKDVVAVLDDNPSQDDVFWQKHPIQPLELDINSVGAVILSSDCKQEMMKRRCEEIFGDKLTLVELYAGLPEGPYRK
ncbi:MAG: hypothetical protein C0602_03850 [Denitrovibrio sp.]|nr:MAG: hypothetical protein C0602_03850 [Denitrovibrio sp.]